MIHGAENLKRTYNKPETVGPIFRLCRFDRLLLLKSSNLKYLPLQNLNFWKCERPLGENASYSGTNLSLHHNSAASTAALPHVEEEAKVRRLNGCRHVTVLYRNAHTRMRANCTLRIILGDFPPSSRVTLFRLPAADCWMIFPTF